MNSVAALSSVNAGQLAQLSQAAEGLKPQTISSTQIEKMAPGFSVPDPGHAPAAGSFENVLGGFVNEVSQKQANASATVNGMLSGQNVPLHQAMISVEEANVSFQLMVEVRNRLMDSYQELMRMQV